MSLGGEGEEEKSRYKTRRVRRTFSRISTRENI